MKNKISSITRVLHPKRVSELAEYLLKDEAISGKLILAATVLALIAANSFLSSAYENLWHTKFSIGFGNLTSEKDLRHWIDEGLMAIFFLVVGLELKRELVQGELRKFKTAVLPFAAALGGMIVPALIYVAFNSGLDTFSGWAIPMATDIAFAIAVLALIGPGIPPSIRLFLLSLAIVDDIGAVLVIALFYNSGLNLMALAAAALLVALMLILQHYKKVSMVLFVIAGLSIWLLINASGVHASIAGVIIGLLAPLTVSGGGLHSIAERLERFTIPISTLVVVPLFALANTGIVLSFGQFSQTGSAQIALGIIVGLVAGKSIGILGTVYLMTRLKYADLPEGSTWPHILGVSLLAGIGFTVSIFISDLAFDIERYNDIAKMSIFAASLIAGALGFIVLKRSQKISKVA